MGQPGYRDLADAIRADIAARRLVEGDQLPGVRELAAKYGASVGTVARALDALRSEGVIAAKHGKGLYVQTFSRIVRSSPGRLSREHWGRGKAIQDHDTNGRLRVAHIEVRELPVPDVAAELGVPAGAAVLTRSRRFAVEDRVVQLATSYLPLDVAAAAPAVAYTDPGPGGIYARLAAVGLAPTRFRERVTYREPSSAENAALALPTRVGVYQIVRWAWTAEMRCVEVNVMVLDASAYELEYQFEA